jgi:hypothetical protein
MVSPDAKPVKSWEGDWPIEGKDNVSVEMSLLNYGGNFGVLGRKDHEKACYRWQDRLGRRQNSLNIWWRMGRGIPPI